MSTTIAPASTPTPEALARRCMLVTLNVSTWTARAQDRRAGHRVTTDANAATDAARVYKRLLSDASTYEAIRKIGTEARTFHYDRTLPWHDSGARVLLTTGFLPYAERMREYRDQFQKAVDAFTADYPQLVEAARAHLGALYDPRDYPLPSQVAERFGFRVSTDPLPTGSDFRAEMDAAAQAIIRAEIEDATQKRADAAMRAVWERLHDALSAMADRLATPEAIYRDSLFGNLAGLVDLLPTLNLAGDPALDTTAAELRRRILQATTPEECRRNPTARATTAQAADELAKRMARFMGAPIA